MNSGASLHEARVRLDRVLALSPQHGEALRLRAQLFLSLDEPGRAVIDAENALRALGSDVEVYAILTEASRQTGDIPRALQALQAALTTIDDASDHHLRLSWHALQLNQYDHAEALARVALRRHPDRAAPYQQLARVFVRTNREMDAAHVLHQGFERGVLQSAGMAGDAELATLNSHPLLVPFQQP